jgi:hypothetical protein
MRNDMVREKERIFSEGCMEGFLIIEKKGIEFFMMGKLGIFGEEIIQRILGYFIQIEDYEKCKFIKEKFEKAFSRPLIPIFPNFN